MAPTSFVWCPPYFHFRFGRKWFFGDQKYVLGLSGTVSTLETTPGLVEIETVEL